MKKDQESLRVISWTKYIMRLNSTPVVVPSATKDMQIEHELIRMKELIDKRYHSSTGKLKFQSLV